MTLDEQKKLDECTAPGKSLTLLVWEIDFLNLLGKCRDLDLSERDRVWLMQIHMKTTG